MEAAAVVARIPVLERMLLPGKASIIEFAFCFGSGVAGVENALAATRRAAEAEAGAEEDLTATLESMVGLTVLCCAAVHLYVVPL
jgi:hypothetical protein